MELHYRTIGSGPAFVLLHGLFGMADNWQTLARRWAEELGRTVYLVDQRNHGRSPHDPVINYETLTTDLVDFFRRHQLGPDTVVLGHSMGGKVAMNFALRHPDQLAKLIVVDIAPRAYTLHHRRLLDGLLALKLGTITTREEADSLMNAFAPEIGTRQFLLKNLYRQEDGSFGWRLNLEALDQYLPALGAEVTYGEPFMKPTLFIKGGKSDYISSEDKYFHIERLFPNVEIATVVDAGHWVHAENPEETSRLVTEFMQVADTWA